MDKAAVLADIDEVLSRCGASAADPRPSVEFRRDGNDALMIAAAVACVERNFTQPTHLQVMRQTMGAAVYEDERVKRFVGLLVAIRQDVDAGHFRTIARRAEDEVFDDLLGMAAHIATLHVAPGVVLAVSVLEERIRGLAAGQGIETVKANGDARSFDDLATELYKASILTKPELKSLQAAYAQRTEAAHGHFDKVVADEVPRIIASVRDFLARHP